MTLRIRSREPYTTLRTEVGPGKLHFSTTMTTRAFLIPGRGRSAWGIEVFADRLTRNHYHACLRRRKEICLGLCAMWMGFRPDDSIDAMAGMALCFAAVTGRFSWMRTNI